MSAHLVPAVRDLFGQHPRAARLSPEQVAGLLWILCYVPDEDGPLDPFEIADTGGVSCTRDGRPVTTFRQTLAEEWYWEMLEEGPGHLVHDVEAQAFYTPAGDLALSRDVVDLRYLMPR